MGIQMAIESLDRQRAQVAVNALETYRKQLRSNIERTKSRLTQFEQRSGVSTTHFLAKITAEDLPCGDLEYVEWAGEAKLLEKLEAELKTLEHARYHAS